MSNALPAVSRGTGHLIPCRACDGTGSGAVRVPQSHFSEAEHYECGACGGTGEVAGDEDETITDASHDLAVLEVYAAVIAASERETMTDMRAVAS